MLILGAATPVFKLSVSCFPLTHPSCQDYMYTVHSALQYLGIILSDYT